MDDPRTVASATDSSPKPDMLSNTPVGLMGGLTLAGSGRFATAWSQLGPVMTGLSA